MICSENKNEDKTGGVGLGIILVSESANGSHPGLDPSGFIKTVSEDTVFCWSFCFLFDCDPSFYMGIDVVHGRKQFLEDREVVGDDHARLLVGNHLFNRNIEEFSEVFEMVVLQGDADHPIIGNLFAVQGKLFEVAFLSVIDHLHSLGDLIEFAM